MSRLGIRWCRWRIYRCAVHAPFHPTLPLCRLCRMHVGRSDLWRISWADYCLFTRLAFCACYASNTWNTQNFPFLTQLLYSLNGKSRSKPYSIYSLSYTTGTEYDQLSILNDDFTLNLEKLEQQGLPWYAASQLLYKVSRTIYIGGKPAFVYGRNFETHDTCNSGRHPFLPLALGDSIRYHKEVQGRLIRKPLGNDC